MSFPVIDGLSFTPWHALAGGLLIGAAAALLVAWNGRIAGISGIIGGLLHPARGDVMWRVAFIVGLISAPWLYRVIAPWPPLQIDASWPRLLIAGFMVGLGTRYGAGCTSGHGVCGLSRRSWRSVVATGTFMAAGFLTVAFLRHGVGV